MLALDAVRDLSQVDVYSPTREHREEFAAEFDNQLDANVCAVDSAEAAIAEKDIINTATNSLEPVIDPDWLEPGVHVSSVKKQEVTSAVFRSADVPIVHSAEQTTEHNVIVQGEEPIPEFEVEDRWWMDTSKDIWAGIDPLKRLIAGDIGGRETPDQITLFANNIGLGIQFAACCHLLFDRAQEVDVGEDLPIGWFLQDIL